MFYWYKYSIVVSKSSVLCPFSAGLRMNVSGGILGSILIGVSEIQRAGWIFSSYMA